MVHIQHSVVIHEPVETVFRALADFPAEPSWQPAVLETTLVPPGPVQVGTKTVQKRKFGGRQITTVGEIIQYEPDHKIVSRSAPDNPPPAFEIVYEVKAVDQGTQVTYTIDLSGTGIFALILPLMKGSLTKDIVKRFATLKTRLEAEHALH